MIGVYATCTVKTEHKTDFETLVQQFIKESRPHTGCESYDCGKINDTKNDYCFIERRTTQADLDAHLSSIFLQENAPKLAAMSVNGLAIKAVDLI